MISNLPSTPSAVETKPAVQVKLEKEGPKNIEFMPGMMEALGFPPNMPMDLATLQAAQMMQMPLFNMMPMPMHMTLPMAMNLHPPLMPMMMSPEMNTNAYHQSNINIMDPNNTFWRHNRNNSNSSSNNNSNNNNRLRLQLPQAAAQSKRARTRISDDQLKILRNYFDINNSPTEAQIQEMSNKSGLPQKVIKHWFRNTLFKERQRNKDSPYNFSNLPTTTLNLEEYEKTGKIPDDETSSLLDLKEDKNNNADGMDGRDDEVQMTLPRPLIPMTPTASVSTLENQDRDSVTSTLSTVSSDGPFKQGSDTLIIAIGVIDTGFSHAQRHSLGVSLSTQQ